MEPPQVLPTDTAATPGEGIRFARTCQPSPAASPLWNRDSALLVADQHADYFIRNQLVILAERRVALSVMQPKAFVDGSFAA